MELAKTRIRDAGITRLVTAFEQHQIEYVISTLPTLVEDLVAAFSSGNKQEQDKELLAARYALNIIDDVLIHYDLAVGAVLQQLAREEGRTIIIQIEQLKDSYGEPPQEPLLEGIKPWADSEFQLVLQSTFEMSSRVSALCAALAKVGGTIAEATLGYLLEVTQNVQLAPAGGNARPRFFASLQLMHFLLKYIRGSGALKNSEVRNIKLTEDFVDREVPNQFDPTLN